MPQEIDWLWPMTTPGSPEKVKPVTSYGQEAPTVRQCRPIWYHSDGIWGARCGSFASSGLPVVVYFPETTQELEPMPLPDGPSSAGTLSTLLDSADSWVAEYDTPGAGAAVVDVPADGTKSLPVAVVVTVPPSTIGRFRSYGYSG